MFYLKIHIINHLSNYDFSQDNMKIDFFKFPIKVDTVLSFDRGAAIYFLRHSFKKTHKIISFLVLKERDIFFISY